MEALNMVVLNMSMPKNCLVCPLNFSNLCIGAYCVTPGNAFDYRVIDTEFSEGTEHRAEWCPLNSDEMLMEKISKYIDKMDFKMIGENSKNIKPLDTYLTERSDMLKNKCNKNNKTPLNNKK